MSDLIVMGDPSTNPYATTEHYLRKMLSGDIKTVRARLISALERLDYDILDDDENMIRGRRQARGWGSSYSSADVLDYPMTLIIKLKPQSEHATRATFDYVVKHPSLSTGEKEILTREAEAISALAMVRYKDKICAACGTGSTDDSKFCRRCGTKMELEVSELEVLRMSAEIRAGYTSVVATFVALLTGLGFTGASLASMVASGIYTKGSGVLLVIGLTLDLLALIFISFGWNRVSRSLKRPKTTDRISVEPIPALLSPDQSVSLVAPGSVTERTTNLLTLDNNRAKTGEFAAD